MIAYEYGGALYLNITNRCTNDCDFCIRRYADGVAGHHLWLDSEPTVPEIIDAIQQFGPLTQFREIVFCGYGEPLSRFEDVVEVCRYLKERQAPPIRIDTNGQASRIHGRNVVPELVGLEDMVSISLNAPTAEEYARICRPVFGEEGYRAMLEFARLCVGLLPAVTMTVLDLPGVDIEACRTIAEELGAKFRVRHFSREF
jgi:TatD family-associated radical SAM protein